MCSSDLEDAPDTLYYVNPVYPNLQGKINIINATPGTGPGFWIQTDPGIDGKIPSTPNISSRDILGVFNNGEDLGSVTFNVPLSTAQDFYYSLTSIGTVDLVTNLKFNQINNQYVVPFNETWKPAGAVTVIFPGAPVRLLPLIVKFCDADAEPTITLPKPLTVPAEIEGTGAAIPVPLTATVTLVVTPPPEMLILPEAAPTACGTN